ncbi:MAG: phosphoribosylglycinamide formyltransferase [Bacteroidetes bacterium]|nr:phosphoribosylglycinamide formyltransferase [Bacteroidota bacterium]
MKQRLAILASGSGSNAEGILGFFDDHDEIDVVFVGCNRPEAAAGVYEKSRRWGVETTHITKQQLASGQLQSLLNELEVNWVILAGFLLKIPTALVQAFHGRMLNIHPSLLPNFGGEGMYGGHVHSAVSDAGVTESGMTVHWVTENYDEGEIVFQASCEIEAHEAPDSIAAKVQALEHQYFPRVIAQVIQSQMS